MLGPELGEPLGAAPDDVRHIAERLDVVDQRRAAVEALDGGEGGPEARVAALSLQRIEQSGLLTADVGASAAVDDELQTAAAAEDVLSQIAGLVSLGHGGGED